MSLPDFPSIAPTHWLAWLSVVFHLALSVTCTVHILLTKRDHVAAFGWVATCLLFPVAGSLLYFFFGINRIKTRARALDIKSTVTADESILSTPQPDAETESRLIETLLPEELKLTAHISSFLTRHRLVRYNNAVPLFNAEQAYPDMLAAIESARRYIYLSTYLFATDRCGRQFIDALGEAVKRGVAVYVILDGVGEWYHWPHAGPLLREAGATVARFLPPRLIPLSVHLNLRTHRKLLIVDGETAYAGGMNIGCNHHVDRRDRQTRPALQDIHFRFEGPVASQLEQVFIDDWNFVSDRMLECAEPGHARRGEAICRTLADGPNKDLDTLPMVLTGVISSARRRVTIMTPYFLPPRELISALQAAALRGVAVDVILPEKSNLRFVDWACRRILPELLQRGVNIYLQPPPFAHSKLCLIDDGYCLVGSANLDPRSLILNFEVVVEIFDRALNVTLDEHCRTVAGRARRLEPAELRQQSPLIKLRNAFFWLFSSYL